MPEPTLRRANGRQKKGKKRNDRYITPSLLGTDTSRYLTFNSLTNHLQSYKKTLIAPASFALYDIWTGTGAGVFLEPQGSKIVCILKIPKSLSDHSGVSNNHDGVCLQLVSDTHCRDKFPHLARKTDTRLTQRD